MTYLVCIITFVILKRFLNSRFRLSFFPPFARSLAFVRFLYLLFHFLLRFTRRGESVLPRRLKIHLRDFTSVRSIENDETLLETSVSVLRTIPKLYNRGNYIDAITVNHNTSRRRYVIRRQVFVCISIVRCMLKS